MWPSSLHSLELGGAHCPCVSAAIFPDACGTAGHPAYLSPAAGIFYWNWSRVHHWPPLSMYHELLASWHTPKCVCMLQLPPHGWTCAPAPHFGCQQSSLGGSLCWGAAFDPYMDEPPVRPVVLPKDPPSVTDPVRPDSMVWPKWPNPIINFLSWCKFSSCQRQGKACWKLKANAGANSALFQQLNVLGFRGTAFHWQKWETKLWPTLFRKWRKNIWFKDSPSMAEKFF